MLPFSMSHRGLFLVLEGRHKSGGLYLRVWEVGEPRGEYDGWHELDED